jgi:hypothetical protein
MQQQFPDLGEDVPELQASELKGRLDGVARPDLEDEESVDRLLADLPPRPANFERISG